MSGPELPQPGPAEHLQKKEGTPTKQAQSSLLAHYPQFESLKFKLQYHIYITEVNLNSKS